MEKSSKKVTGIMKFQDIETGFWTLIDNENKKVYRFVNKIKELEVENLNVEIEYKISDNSVSVFMLGIPIDVIDFKIIK